MSDDLLFDPADYGATVRERKPRTPAPDTHSVVVRPPWMVLRSLKESPRAHRIGNHTPNVYGAIFAECGAKGTPISDLAGSDAPACPRCWVLNERAVS